jgi:UDP-N-acetylmuramate--alanine ligase
MGFKKVAAVFAPHTYTRTRDFIEETAFELSRFSVALITDIYGAREDPIVGISSASLAEKTRGYGNKAISVTQKEAISMLGSCDFDCLVLIGAGELDLIKNEIEDK